MLSLVSVVWENLYIVCPLLILRYAEGARSFCKRTTQYSSSCKTISHVHYLCKRSTWHELGQIAHPHIWIVILLQFAPPNSPLLPEEFFQFWEEAILLRLKRGNLMYRFRWSLRLQGYNKRKQWHVLGTPISGMQTIVQPLLVVYRVLCEKRIKRPLSKSPSRMLCMWSYIRWYTFYYTLCCSVRYFHHTHTMGLDDVTLYVILLGTQDPSCKNSKIFLRLSHCDHLDGDKVCL